MTKIEIGNLIRQRRDHLTLKQEDVAEMAGISSKFIYLIEQGKGNASLDTLQKIFEVLGLEIIVDIKRVE
ncbi:helix-turn-helix domain-containing protein [Flavipsychrobacter stenotrophus]|uniref:helix-turn-helix domain-containing protein n=1 Tax=Flavipsychrobacter stenotrophus TaxID=2077091 RepID=UPI00196A46E9|nr:helix-turn-helix domain-containing protein [Flavipsychrobacter stenotrophus]